jgi:transcriptional regulator with GAF, ATPase, and Fis domain
MRTALEHVDLVAPTNATVLLLGETGVGKEVLAEAIHRASPRRDRPMIRVNCGAIPATLIEAELFGHERGAFTDAIARRIGSFEAAHGSTLFLDEIGELPLDMQVKILRAIQERTIDRLGGRQPIKVDVRIIAASNRDLKEAVARRAFREDLFYRLNVFPITIPPLRDRVEDIPVLAKAFVDQLSRGLGKTIEAISRESLQELLRHDWPGNVRELRNVIERALIVADGPVLKPTVREDHPAATFLSRSDVRQSGASSEATDVQSLDTLQSDHIRAVLESCGWRIRGEAGAAQRLGLKPTTLESRMARLGIVRDNGASRSASHVVRQVNAYPMQEFRRD